MRAQEVLNFLKRSNNVQTWLYEAHMNALTQKVKDQGKSQPIALPITLWHQSL